MRLVKGSGRENARSLSQALQACPASCRVTDLVGLLWEEKNQDWAPY